jgi:formate dehydrogenase subunit gamma
MVSATIVLATQHPLALNVAHVHPSSRPATLDAAAQVARVRVLIERHRTRPGPLLPLLHDVQEELGCIPPHAVPVIAEALNLSRAEVHGVVTYYPVFRTAPAGRHVVQVCRAEACQSRGAAALHAHAAATLRCAEHGTRADGAVTLEPVYCLGLCAMSPAVMVDEQPHARMTAARLDQVLGALEAVR